jgi:hypothetical protein
MISTIRVRGHPGSFVDVDTKVMILFASCLIAHRYDVSDARTVVVAKTNACRKGDGRQTSGYP